MPVSVLHGMNMVTDFKPLARVLCTDDFYSDNLQVQWGTQDHYEIVRKVGRGKYSEVRRIVLSSIWTARLIDP
jgi:hypothetical protein